MSREEGRRVKERARRGSGSRGEREEDAGCISN